MSLNPIIALDHVIEEYRDHLQSEFRARDRALRQALETELDRTLFLAQEQWWANGERYRQLDNPSSSISTPPPPLRATGKSRKPAGWKGCLTGGTATKPQIAG